MKLRLLFILLPFSLMACNSNTVIDDAQPQVQPGNEDSSAEKTNPDSVKDRGYDPCKVNPQLEICKTDQ